MRITLELSSAVEGRLRESVAQGDADAVRRLLAEVLTPTVETLLQEMPVELTEAEFEATADQLADALTVDIQNDHQALAAVHRTWATVSLNPQTLRWVAEDKELEYDLG